MIGQTVNTNGLDGTAPHGRWLARLWRGDDFRQPDDIRREIDRFERADVVLVTGGLGPTKDDLTKHVLASHFGTELVMHEDIAQNIQAWFESRNVPFLK